MLRDISSSLEPEEVLKIFSSLSLSSTPSTSSAGSESLSYQACPLPISVKAELNNTWYVSFQTENDAKVAFNHCKTTYFQGNLLKVRLKADRVNNPSR
jgi:hypothetical protein